MTALVTGASGGLGRAIAVALAQDGHDVAVHFRSDEVGAVETSRLVESTGRRAYAVARDLAIAEPAALDEAVEGLLDEVIDALIDVEKRLPSELKCATIGGLACTKTAVCTRKKLTQ